MKIIAIQNTFTKIKTTGYGYTECRSTFDRTLFFPAFIAGDGNVDILEQFTDNTKCNCLNTYVGMNTNKAFHTITSEYSRHSFRTF